MMSVVAEPSPRQQLIDAALMALEKAAHAGVVLSLAAEARRLSECYPGSGMTDQDIREMVAKLAVKRGIAIGFD
jgi:hypothetical protein